MHEVSTRHFIIATAGHVDHGKIALVVIAADDGWMPQTEEHLQILTYLGIQRTIVALTKCDLGKIDVVTAQIRAELERTPFKDSQIIPTSVRTGEGITNLKSSLA